jgi:hypothetical protein
MKFIYEIDGQRLAACSKIRILEKFRTDQTDGYKLRDLVQVVRPPHGCPAPREAWETGDVYFPTLWVAPDGIYSHPVTVILPSIVVPTHIKQPFDKNYQTASHVALLDIDSKLETLAVRHFPVTAPPGAKLIGVYSRCRI